MGGEREIQLDDVDVDRLKAFAAGRRRNPVVGWEHVGPDLRPIYLRSLPPRVRRAVKRAMNPPLSADGP